MPTTQPTVAVSSEATAAPTTAIRMPLRRPIRSTIGPIPKATSAVPAVTQVLIPVDWAALQPRSEASIGRRLPNRTKS